MLMEVMRRETDCSLEPRAWQYNVLCQLGVKILQNIIWTIHNLATDPPCAQLNVPQQPAINAGSGQCVKPSSSNVSDCSMALKAVDMCVCLSVSVSLFVCIPVCLCVTKHPGLA